MTDNEAALAHRTLHDVTLPGSHDSASFYLDRKIMPGSLPWPLNDIVQVATDIGVSTADYIIKWSQSQTLDIAEQLNAGVRYFDLRAGVALAHALHWSGDGILTYACSYGWPPPGVCTSPLRRGMGVEPTADQQ